MNQGRKANRAGKTVEDVIYCIFKERGYQVERQYDIGHNVYGHNHRCDFYILGVPGFNNGLIIESKWQSVNGSVDEKYPFLVANVKSVYPAPCLIVADGGGMKDGALEWLKGQVDGVKLIAVFSMEELIKWVINNGF